ncbi:hypothetical protein Taro_005768 [Colocasia esculenta]|uniref:Uncharacterized protein n=1 Tax=Colocasia esculenta TaxID=4460 RepID=A0A843TV90_COLES|nr:hypothetical protein [Colocasia esculenta]
MLTSALGRRRPPTSRLGRDGDACRVLNGTQFITKVGQTELSMLCLAKGRSCYGDFGRFGIWGLFLTRSRCEDTAWSGGDTVSWLVCVFLTKVWCWLVSTILWLMLVERQLDLSSVTARLRGSSCVVLSGWDTGIMNQ